MKKILCVKNLSKKIKNKLILNNISFELENNTILGLVGPNGSGKSSLLKCILGMYHYSGEIKISKVSLKNKYEYLSSIGSIIETPIFYENMTGFQNINLYKKLYKNIDNSYITELIKKLNMENFINNKVKTYSLGMKQKLGILNALINKPKLLILDEPTNGLDPFGIKELKEFLLNLKSTTIIISSHILSYIEDICTEVMFISKGEKILMKKISEYNNKSLEEEFINILGDKK